MNRNDLSEQTPPGIIAFSAWLREIGRSDTTGWRWARAGWLHPINIAGRRYLTRKDIRQFQTRAAAGEFSKAPAGAAGASSQGQRRKEVTE